MPVFAYKARDARGKMIAGREEAATHSELEVIFHGRSLIPIEVHEIGSSKRASVPLPWKKKLTDTELIAFTRQLATA
jgi:type II secretory pathway component PulF